MKKVLSFAAILTMFFGLVACEADSASAEELYEAGCATCEDIDPGSECATCEDIDPGSDCATCEDIDPGN